MNRDVSITKRVKTPQGFRYCPVVLSANGRIRPDWVLVSGREERHPEGGYYLEWRESTKRTWLSIGNDPARRRRADSKRKLSSTRKTTEHCAWKGKEEGDLGT